MEVILSTNNLSKRYGKSDALNDVTINIQRGDIYGLIGKNGAGKTTFMRLITGLQEPTSGTYSFWNTKNSDEAMSQTRLRIGALVEAPAIYPDMSGLDNLKHQSDILGLPDYDNAKKILKTVGLESVGGLKARNYSLGMKERLGIGLALVGNPDFLILDEPMNGLDPEGVIEIRELLLNLNKNFGITILISSHILDELSKIATRYGFLDKGALINEITSAELEDICRKCIKVTVTDSKRLACALDELELDFEVTSDTTATIYAEISITALVMALSKTNCELISCNVQKESLENYFLNLLGENKNE